MQQPENEHKGRTQMVITERAIRLKTKESCSFIGGFFYVSISDSIVSNHCSINYFFNLVNSKFEGAN